MLKTLASHNPDLQRLLDKGYALAVDSNCLVVRDIPYLDSAGELRWSAFVAKLVLEDQIRVRPENHQIFFAAQRPFGLDGQVVRGLGGGNATLSLSDSCSDIIVKQSFSHKLKEDGQLRDYVDHFEKIESYVAIVCGPAMSRFGVSPYTFREYQEETSNSVFKLRDTMTSRAQISDLVRILVETGQGFQTKLDTNSI
jgi:hypothetical protein